MTLVVRSPAKINLGLWITGKRPDGYHELETLFQMVSLYDTLTFESSLQNVTLTCNLEGLPTGEDNLVMRAARALQQRFPDRRDLGCRIHLEKSIPHGAGLGGGSGNAAMTLWALNGLWKLGLSRDDLMEIGAGLGSDVSFFLCAPTAIGRGRGEQLTPLQPIHKFPVILIYPKVSISTALIYQRFKMGLTRKQNNISILTEFLSQSDTIGLGQHLHNDLEPVVLEGFPEVAQVKEKLSAQNAQGVLVSGSGSVVFALYADHEQASRAYAQCKAGDWDIFLTETVSSFTEFVPENILHYPAGG